MSIPSKIKPKQKLNSGRATQPQQMMLLALIHIVEPDASKAKALYKEYSRAPGVFLKRIALREIKIYPNSHMDELRSLTPTNKVLHFYIGSMRRRIPSHYIVLDFDMGCYIPRSQRLITIKGKISHNGVIAVPSDSRPSFVEEIHLERIFNGGSDFGLLCKEIETNYEVRRSLTHSLLAGYIADALPQGKFSLRERQGKATFLPHINLDDPQAVTGVAPWTFEFKSAHPYAQDVDRFPCVIYTDADPSGIKVPQVPRCILPRIKRPEYSEDNSMLEVYLRAFLEARLLPYLGVRHGSARTVDFYGLSYQPDTLALLHLKTKKEINCEDALYFVMPGKGYGYPAPLLASALKALLFEYGADEAAQKSRFIALHEAFGLVFGITTSRKLQIAFDDWGMPLSQSEQQIHAQRFSMWMEG